jgi:FkbM family methyltransferase
MVPLLKRLIQSTSRKFGYRIVRDVLPPPVSDTPPAYGLDNFFSLIKRYGFDPKNIVDVGANRGTWTRKALSFFPDASYTLVEPQDHLKVHIQDLFDRGHKISWINAGVADRPGILPFTVSYRDDSSTFAMTPTDSTAQRIDISVTTLNRIVSSTNASFPEMVKIDAEGFDLKVLAGASDLLGKTELFFVEVTICSPAYENTIAKVINRMDQAGYRVVDVTDLNRSSKFGVLWLCELAFLRNDSALFDTVTSFE